MVAEGAVRQTIATLYERWTLDVIPCLGRPIAKLSQDNPQEFKRVPAATLGTLADLRYRTGFDSTYLDEEGRKALLMPVLGDSDGVKARERSGPFHRSADAVRSRAKDFARRAYDTGEEQLRNAFRDAVTTLQRYLTTVSGGVVDDASIRLTKHFDDVVHVLQTTQFAAGLGFPPAPRKPWPLRRSFDGDGAMLVQAITQRAEVSGGKPIVTGEEFLQIQRIASYGAETIEAVLTREEIYTVDGVTDDVINSAYRWWTAISEYRETSETSDW